MRNIVKRKFGIVLGKMIYGTSIAMLTYLIFYAYNKSFSNWGLYILASLFMILMMVGSYIEEISKEGKT